VYAQMAAESLYVSNGSPEFLEKEATQRRVDMLIRKESEMTIVELKEIPEKTENTAYLQQVVQVITKPAGPHRRYDLSKQYPPATKEMRTLPDHDVVLMRDLRPSARRAFMKRGDGMPETLVTATYNGVPLAEAHQLVFAGISMTGLKTMYAEHGGENLAALRLTGHATLQNPSRIPLRAGNVIAFGPPTVTVTKKLTGAGEVEDPSKHPKTYILDMTDRERGDMETCPPVPYIVNPSSVPDRMYAIMTDMLISIDSLFQESALKRFAYHGDVEAIRIELEKTFIAMRKATEAEIDAEKEFNAYWLQIQRLIEAVLPPMRPHAAVQKEWKENQFLPLNNANEETVYIQVLASLIRGLPECGKLTLDEAGTFLRDELMNTMKYLGDANPGIHILNQDHFDVDDPAGLSQARQNSMFYTVARRLTTLQYVFKYCVLHAKALEAQLQSLRNQAHALVIADSQPGERLAITLLRHG
jgi:hypothetical protein